MTSENTTDTLTPERQAERNEVLDKAAKAKEASRVLLSTEQKNQLLSAAADALEANTDAILAANEEDVKAGRERGFDDALIDRLSLDADRVKGIAGGLRQVVGLPDPVGEIVRGHTRPNGLRLKQGSYAAGRDGHGLRSTPERHGRCLRSGREVR